MRAGYQLDVPSQLDGAMNETVVPTSARALGSIRHPQLGSKKHATVQKDLTRGVQSALHDSNGNSWTLNVGSTAADSKPSKRLAVSGSATSGPFSANSVSKHSPGADLRWGHRNKDLSASQSKPSINQAINDVITGLQFHAINGRRDSFDEDNFEDTQRGSSNGNGLMKSGKRRMVGGQRTIDRGRAFVELNGRQKQKQRWPLSHNYLDDGDFVKGRGHRIDTGPMSRPVSGWMNRESRNAVELAEQDRGEGGLGRYYSLDVGTGAVTARQLTNGEGILIGVNGQERRRGRQTSGRYADDDGGEDGEDGEEEAEELASDAEELDRVNVESDEAAPTQFVPLCWDDQFMKPEIKVVKPRLPSAQPSSTTTTSANEPTPVVFWSRSSQQRDATPPSITKLQTPTKENYASMTLQRKSGKTPKKKKPQSVKFNEFRHPIARGATTSNIIDGDEDDEERMEYSFRHGSMESRGTWNASVFPGAGSENPGVMSSSLRMVNGRHGVDVHADMIVVGCSQMSSKTMENEKPMNRSGGAGSGVAGEGEVREGEGGVRREGGEVRRVGGGVGSASEKHLSAHHSRRGSGLASRESQRSTTPREVSIINIVQPLRMNNGESDDIGDTAAEVRKTSARRRNESAMIRLRYSVGGNLQRASTGVRRTGPHPEGLHKKGNSGPMVRSASVREGRLATISREGSSYDWNLNCINIKSAAVHSDAAPYRDRAAQSNKTVDWSNEDAGRNGSRTGRKERDTHDRGNSDLSQPFEVVQLSPIRAKTASQQTRNTQSLDDHHHHNEANDNNNNATAFGGSSEIISSAAPPPSRAATPNARGATTTSTTTSTTTATAMRISAHNGEPSSSSSPRRGVVTLHVPSAAKSQASECDEDLQLERRSPEIENEDEMEKMEKSLRRENSNGEDVERSCLTCFEERGPEEACELGFDTELEDTMDSVSLEGRIESQSPAVV